MCIYECVLACMHVGVCARACVCVHACVRVCVCVWVGERVCVCYSPRGAYKEISGRGCGGSADECRASVQEHTPPGSPVPLQRRNTFVEEARPYLQALRVPVTSGIPSMGCQSQGRLLSA